MKTSEEIAMIIDNAKRIGVHTVTIDDVVYDLHRNIEPKLPVNPSQLPTGEVTPEDIFKNASPFDEPSDDEVLYWSSPYMDILEAQKLERAQQLKDSELANG